MCKVIISILFCIFISNTAIAGPFGTNINDNIEKYNNLKQIAPNKYVTNFLPNSHESFTPYILEFNKNGLHSVAGIGKLLINDQRCYQIIREFNKLKKLLTEKYGDPTKLENNIRVGDKDAIFSFSRSVFNSGPSNLYALWDKDLPDGLSKIILIGDAEDKVDGETRLSILYEYNNYSKNDDSSL